MVDLKKAIDDYRTSFISVKGYRPTVVLLAPPCVALLRTETGNDGKDVKFQYDNMAIRSCPDLTFSEIELY